MTGSVRTPLGFEDLNLNPYLGATVRLTNEAYTVGITDRRIILTSTDAVQYALTFPAVGRPQQTVDIFMPVNPTGAGSFLTVGLGSSIQYTFDRVRHITAYFDDTVNQWILFDASSDSTMHFNVGNIGAPALGVVGVPTPAAMSFFGQINVSRPKHIRVNHLHLVEDGTGGTLTIELWRRRAGVFTLLGTNSYTAPTADFVTSGMVPAGDLANVTTGDYLFAQATVSTILALGGNGLTFDVHFEDETTLIT